MHRLMAWEMEKIYAIKALSLLTNFWTNIHPDIFFTAISI
jgi:hypothetical protein